MDKDKGLNVASKVCIASSVVTLGVTILAVYGGMSSITQLPQQAGNQAAGQMVAIVVLGPLLIVANIVLALISFALAGIMFTTGMVCKMSSKGVGKVLGFFNLLAMLCAPAVVVLIHEMNGSGERLALSGMFLLVMWSMAVLCSVLIFRGVR